MITVNAFLRGMCRTFSFGMVGLTIDRPKVETVDQMLRQAWIELDAACDEVLGK